MSAEEENKASVRRFLTERIKGNLNAVNEMLAPDFVDFVERSMLPDQELSREDYKPPSRPLGGAKRLLCSLSTPPSRRCRAAPRFFTLFLRADGTLKIVRVGRGAGSLSVVRLIGRRPLRKRWSGAMQGVDFGEFHFSDTGLMRAGERLGVVCPGPTYTNPVNALLSQYAGRSGRLRCPRRAGHPHRVLGSIPASGLRGSSGPPALRT